MYASREKTSYPDRFASRKWVPLQTSYSGQRPNDGYASASFSNARPSSNTAGDDEPYSCHAARPLVSDKEEILIYRDRNPAGVPGSAQLQDNNRPPADRYGRAPSWRAKPKACSTSTSRAPSLRRKFEDYYPKSPRSSHDERTTRGHTPAQRQHGSSAALDRYRQARHWIAKPRADSTITDTVPATWLSPPKYQSAGDAREKRFLREDWAKRQNIAAELRYRTQHNASHYVPRSSWHQCATDAPRKNRSHGTTIGAKAAPGHHVAFRTRPSADGPRDIRLFRDGHDDYKPPGIQPQYLRQSWIPRRQTATSRRIHEVNTLRESLPIEPAGSDRLKALFPRNNNVEYQYSSGQFQHGHQPDTTRQFPAPPQNRDLVDLSWDTRFCSEPRDFTSTSVHPASVTYAPLVASVEMSFSREWGNEKKAAEFHLQHDRRLLSEQMCRLPHRRVPDKSSVGTHLVPSHRADEPGGRPHTLALSSAANSICRVANKPEVKSYGGAPAAQVASYKTGEENTKRATANGPLQAAYSARLLNHQGTNNTPTDLLAEILAIGPAPAVGPRGSTSAVPHVGAVAPVTTTADNAATPSNSATAIAIVEITERAGVPAAPCDKDLDASAATRPKPGDGTGLLQSGGPAVPITTTHSASAKAETSAAVDVPSTSSKAFSTAAPPNLAAPPKKKPTAGILKVAASARSGQLSGNDGLSKVAPVIPGKVVSFASPLETNFVQPALPKATKNTQLRKDVRRPSTPQSGRLAGNTKTTAAASVKAVGTAAHPTAAAAAARLSKASRTTAPAKAAVCYLPRKVHTGARPSKAAAGNAKEGSYVSRPIRSMTKQVKRVFKGKEEPPSSPSFSSSSFSDSDSSDSSLSSSSSSASSSTSSLSSSDSDSPSENLSYAGSKSPFGSTGVSGTRRCSYNICHSVEAHGSASSTSKSRGRSSARKKTSCIRSHLDRRKTDVPSSVQRPAITTQAVKPKAPIPKVCIPVIPKSTQANLPNKRCKGFSKANNIQTDRDKFNQKAQGNAATIINAENNKSSSTMATATFASSGSTRSGSEHALLCRLGAPRADQSVLPCEASLCQQQRESGLRQGEKYPPSSHGNSGPSGTTSKEVTKKFTSETLPSKSTLGEDTVNYSLEESASKCSVALVETGNLLFKAAGDTVQPPDAGAATGDEALPFGAGAAPPKEKQDCENVTTSDKVQLLGTEAPPKKKQDCGNWTTADKAQSRGAEATPPKVKQGCENVTTADKVQPLGAEAALMKEKQDCELVQNRYGSKGQTATLPARRKIKQNNSDASLPTVKVKKSGGAASSSKKRCTRLADLISSDVGGIPQLHSPSSGVVVDVRSTVKAAAGRKATKAGGRRTGLALKSSPCAATKVPPTVKDALAQSAVTTAGSPGAHTVMSSDEVAVQLSAFTSAASSTFATTQAAVPITPVPAPAVPRSPVMNSAGCKPTIIDGPCACELTPAGLVNLGRTCSFNALLQALSATRVFSEFCNDVYPREMSPAFVAASTTTARTLGANNLAAAIDQLEAKKISKVLLTPVGTEGNAAPGPQSYLDSPVANSGTREYSMARDKEKNTILAGVGGVLENHEIGASGYALKHQDFATAASVGKISQHMGVQEDPQKSGPKNLTLSGSLAAILYQMCNGTHLNSSSTEENNDTASKTPIETATTGQQLKELENARKQLRVLKQLRTKKWCEQEDESVLNPASFVRQVKLLNVEFQCETELDVEEIWRCIADRLLQEGDDECRRLALLLEDASSHLKQRPRPEAGLLGGSGERQSIGSTVLEERGQKEQGRSLIDNRSMSFSKPRCLGDPPERCTRGETPVFSLAHDMGDAKSSSFAGKSGRECMDEERLPSSTLVSNDHLQQEQRSATDGCSAVRAEGIEKTPVDLEGTLQRIGNKTQKPQGPEKAQNTAAADGGTLRIVGVDNNGDCTTSSTTNGHLGKESVSGQKDEGAEVVQKGLQARTAGSKQGSRRRLKKGGRYVSRQRMSRNESPCTPPDIPGTKKNPNKEVERNCLLAADALNCAPSSSQLAPFNEQSPHCLPDEGQKEQTPTEEVASSLRAAQDLHRRLQNALTGRLVHVPVACRCCCPCNSVTVPNGNILEQSLSLSREGNKISSTIPSLLQTSIVGSSSSRSSTVDQKSGPSLSTTASSSCPRDNCASGLCRLLDRRGLRGGNERSDESDTSSRGTCETSNGVPASRISSGNNSGSHGRDLRVKKLVEAVTERLRSDKGKPRLLKPRKESDSEGKTFERHRMAERGTAETTCASTVIEGAAAAAAESDSGKTLVTEMSSTSHPSEGQSVSESPREVTSKIDACSNHSKTANRAISNGGAARLQSDMMTETQQSAKESFRSPNDTHVPLTDKSTAFYGHGISIPSTRCLPPPDIRVLAFVPNAPHNATSGSLSACNSTEVSTSLVSRTESVANLSSPLDLPAAGVKPVVPSSSAVKAQEELIVAAFPLRLPERSRWAASRFQGDGNRMQSRSAQVAGSSTQGEQGPITLEECLNLALEHRCNGESVVIAAQKTAARSRKGRALAAEVKGEQQISCRQRGPKARKGMEDDLNGLVLCNECGHLACQPCNETRLDAKTGTGSETCVTSIATSPEGKDVYRKGTDELPRTTKDKHRLNCAAVPTEQGRAAGESDVNDEVPSNATSGKQLKCHYCNRVHTKTYFEQLPHLLILQLQRSSPAEISARHASRAAALAFTGGGVKIKAHVQFPLELQEALLPYCRQPDQAVKSSGVLGSTPGVHGGPPVVGKAVGDKRCCGRAGGASCTVSSIPRHFASGGGHPPCTSSFPAPPLDETVQSGAAVHEADTPPTLRTGRRVYKLRAVIEHQGRTGTSGHYVCFRRGFTCRRLKRMSAEEPVKPVCLATDSCAAGALANRSHTCEAGPFLFTASAGNASPSIHVIPSAIASSDSILSVQLCRPCNPTSLLPPRSVAINQSSVKVDELQSPDACDAACVTHAHQQGMLIPSSALEEKTVETQNRMSPCALAVDDQDAHQQEIQGSKKEASRGTKRIRGECQQNNAFASEAENRPRTLVSEVSAPASASPSRKRHCTGSARGDGQDWGSSSSGGGGEGVVPPLHPYASVTSAGHEKLLGGGSIQAGGAKTDRRRKKGEVDPAEKDILEKEDWWEVNDSQASRTTWQQVSLCQAYLLVYELEEPAQPMCEKRYSMASLQAEKLELEAEIKNATQKKAEEQRNKKVAKEVSVKPTTSTSTRGLEDHADKSIIIAVGTGRTGRGRKRGRPPPADDEPSTCTTTHLEPAKRQKQV